MSQTFKHPSANESAALAINRNDSVALGGIGDFDVMQLDIVETAHNESNINTDPHTANFRTKWCHDEKRQLQFAIATI